jgi:hypothetical protein
MKHTEKRYDAAEMLTENCMEYVWMRGLSQRDRSRDYVILYAGVCLTEVLSLKPRIVKTRKWLAVFEDNFWVFICLSFEVINMRPDAIKQKY